MLTLYIIAAIAGALLALMLRASRKYSNQPSQPRTQADLVTTQRLPNVDLTAAPKNAVKKSVSFTFPDIEKVPERRQRLHRRSTRRLLIPQTMKDFQTHDSDAPISSDR